MERQRARKGKCGGTVTPGVPGVWLAAASVSWMRTFRASDRVGLTPLSGEGSTRPDPAPPASGKGRLKRKSGDGGKAKLET